MKFVSTFSSTSSSAIMDPGPNSGFFLKASKPTLEFLITPFVIRISDRSLLVIASSASCIFRSFTRTTLFSPTLSALSETRLITRPSIVILLPDTSIASLPLSRKDTRTMLPVVKSASKASPSLLSNSTSLSSNRPRTIFKASSPFIPMNWLSRISTCDSKKLTAPDTLRSLSPQLDRPLKITCETRDKPDA